MSLCLLTTGVSISFAQGDTKIIVVVQDNKTEVEIGDTFTAYVKAQDAVDLFGLQLTLSYNPDMIQVVDGGVKIEKNMQVFGGEVEDFNQGSLTYPFINVKSTNDKIADMPVAGITFKALKKGPVAITLSNIKAVNSDIREIHYNTQYQTTLNVKEASVTPPKEDSEEPGKPEDEDPSDGDKDETPKPGGKGGTTKPDKEPAGSGESTGESDDGQQQDSSPSENDVDQDAPSKDPDQTPEGDSQDLDDDSVGIDEEERSLGDEEQDTEDKTKNANLVVPWVIAVLALVVLAVGIYIFKDKDGIKNLIDRVISKSKTIRK